MEIVPAVNWNPWVWWITLDLKEMELFRDQAEKQTAPLAIWKMKLTMDFVASVIDRQSMTSIIKQAHAIANNQLLMNARSASERSPFASFSLGSEVVKNQLLRTDQDNALVYERCSWSLVTEEAHRTFLKWQRQWSMYSLLVALLLAQAYIMASNPNGVNRMSQWKSYFSEWIIRPTEEAILSRDNFFDFSARLPANLGFRRNASVFTSMKKFQKQENLLNFLAKNALIESSTSRFFQRLCE